MIPGKKTPPTGYFVFEDLIKDNCYYVDKTGFIIDLLKNHRKANLITRPRRFGKSLNMNMLEAFFSPETDKRIFNGLKITEEKELCEKYMGRYPVISVSMSGIQGADFAQAREMAVKMTAEAARKASSVLESSIRISTDEKSLLHNLLKDDMSDGDLITSIRVLSGLLSKHYREKTIILIDEYDVPLAKASEAGYYDSMVMLIRNMLEQSIKTNTGYKFAVLTGCMRISKESIFTDLNNIKVWSVSDNLFSEYFGFTEGEVCKLLEYYEASNRLGVIKEWYDGYLFGNTHVYCPWDVINYCDDLLYNNKQEPRNNWINTSDNSIIRKFIEQSTNNIVKSEIESLINGDPVEKTINQELTYKDVYSSVDNIWSMLYMSGYLTSQASTEGDKQRLVIPNKEIRQIFTQQIMAFFKERFFEDKKTISVLLDSLIKGNPSDLECCLNRFLSETISLRDTASRNLFKENLYHGIILGMLGDVKGWKVQSNKESGKGYSDVKFLSLDNKTAILIEIKYAEKQALETGCINALHQIEEKHYADDLYDKYEHILKYGIAFHFNECRVMLAE